MTNAIITTATSATGSQTAFLGSLTTAMATAGFALLDSYDVSGNQARVYSYVADAAKTYGTLIIETVFTSATSMVIRGYATWDTATNTGTGVSTNTAKTIDPAVVHGFHICIHPEIRGVNIITSGTPRGFVGYFRPLSPTVDQDLYPFGFIEAGATTSWQSSTTNGLKPISSVHPWSSATMEMLDVKASEADVMRGNARLIIPAAICRTNDSIAEFSSDCVLGASNGMLPLDVFQVSSGVEEYQLFDGAANAAGFARFAVRVV